MLSRAPIVSESQGVPNEPGFVTLKCHGVSDSVCVKVSTGCQRHHSWVGKRCYFV